MAILAELFLIGIFVLFIGGMSVGLGMLVGKFGSPLIIRVFKIPQKRRYYARVKNIATVTTTTFVCLFLFSRVFRYSHAEGFEAITGMPMPKSVTMRHFKSSRIFEGKVWMHFTITPEELQPIISNITTQESPEIGCADNAPRWWRIKPFDLREYQYTFGDRDEGNRLFINDTRTEVYGCHYFRYRID
jgi:hypothetical protein